MTDASDGSPGHRVATGRWHISSSTGPAGPFHHRAVPEPVQPAVWIHQVTGPALVLGSTQSESLVDRQRATLAGVEVARRRSGGGLVALNPANGCWIDVVVPRWSALWSDDVGVAFHWIGRAWAAALGSLLEPGAGASEVRVHEGALHRRRAGAAVCFAGLGPGEVTVGGNKVVGLSMRRWRTGARIQCAMVERWEPGLIADLARPDAVNEALGLDGLTLAGVPAGLPAGVRLDRAALVTALIDALPDPGPAPPGPAPPGPGGVGHVASL